MKYLRRFRIHSLRSTLIVGIVVLCVLVMVSVALAATVSVDPFDEAQQNILVSSGSTDSQSAQDGTILGGERDVELTHLSGGAGIASLRVDNGDDNNLAYSQESGVTSTGLVQWDGLDSSMTRQFTLNADFSPSDGMLISVINNDTPVDLTVTLYTNSSDYSDATVTTPGDIPLGRVDLFIPFSSFSDTGNGVTLSDVDAVELFLDGTVTAGSDLTIDFIEASSDKDFGDLPSSYRVPLGENGPRHVPVDGLRLGDNVDTEANGTESAVADADDTDDSPDDEDGVVRTSGVNWQSGSNGGSVDVTVNGCSGMCYLNGWIDWVNDTDFDDTDEHIFSDQAVSDGTQTLTFDIPSDPANSTFYARFRLCDSTSTCNTQLGEVTGGEVEDYQWSFGPTAVRLNTATTESDAGTLFTPTFALLGLVGLGGVGLALTRRRKQQ